VSSRNETRGMEDLWLEVGRETPGRVRRRQLHRALLLLVMAPGLFAVYSVLSHAVRNGHVAMLTLVVINGLPLLVSLRRGSGEGPRKRLEEARRRRRRLDRYGAVLLMECVVAVAARAVEVQAGAQLLQVPWYGTVLLGIGLVLASARHMLMAEIAELERVRKRTAGGPGKGGGPRPAPMGSRRAGLPNLSSR